MLFNTMKPEFILLLLLLGSLCIAFLMLSIREGFYNKNHITTYFKTASYLSLSFICAITFVKITVPTIEILNIINLIQYVLIIVGTIIIISTVVVFIKTKSSYIKKRFSYTDILDEIDDYILIFDKNGELAAQNIPKNKEPLFTKKINTLDDFINEIGNNLFSTVLNDSIALTIKHGSRHFFVNSTVLKNSDYAVIGAIVLFHDITKEQLLIHKLEIKNKQISTLNIELMQEMMIEEAMMAQEERERLSTSIQREIGEKLNNVILSINNMIDDDIINANQKEQKLKKLAENLRNILADIRSVVYTTRK